MTHDQAAEFLMDRIEAYGEDGFISVNTNTLRALLEGYEAANGAREEGCKYCNPSPYGHGEAVLPLIQQVFKDRAQIHTAIRNDFVHTTAYPSPEDTCLAKTYSSCCKLNFCPMCGKRLGRRGLEPGKEEA